MQKDFFEGSGACLRSKSFTSDLDQKSRYKILENMHPLALPLMAIVISGLVFLIDQPLGIVLGVTSGVGFMGQLGAAYPTERCAEFFNSCPLKSCAKGCPCGGCCCVNCCNNCVNNCCGGDCGCCCCC